MLSTFAIGMVLNRRTAEVFEEVRDVRMDSRRGTAPTKFKKSGAQRRAGAACVIGVTAVAGAVLLMLSEPRQAVHLPTSAISATVTPETTSSPPPGPTLNITRGPIAMSPPRQSTP